MNLGKDGEDEQLNSANVTQNAMIAPRKIPNKSDPPMYHYFYILIGILFIIVIVCTGVDELRKIHQQTIQSISLQLSKQKDSIAEEMAAFQQMNSYSLEDLKNNLAEQTEEIEDLAQQYQAIKEENKITATLAYLESQIEIKLEEQRGEIALQRNGQLNQYESMENKIERIQNSQWGPITSELYPQNAIKEKKEYEKKLLEFLSSFGSGFDQMLPRHKYNFQLKDDPKDIQAHYHTNIKNEYKSSYNDLPICVILPSYLQISDYAIEHTLNSIFRQDYVNYIAVIFSSPNKKINTFVQTYLRFNNLQRYRYVKSSVNGTSLQNIHNAVHNYCRNNSIAIIIEGGNALLSKQAFKSVNSMHKESLQGLFVTNNLKIDPEKKQAYWGATMMPQKKDVDEKNYTLKTSFQLFSFRTEVFKEIKIEDFKDKNGQFFSSYVFALIKPLLQLSCGMAKRVSGVYMLEYIKSDEDTRKIEIEKTILDSLKLRPNYPCSEYLSIEKEKLSGK